MWLEFHQSFRALFDIPYSFSIGDEQGCRKPLKFCHAFVGQLVRYELNLLYVAGRCLRKSL